MPVRDIDCLPLKAITTPVARLGIVTATGELVLLCHMSREPETPTSLSRAVATTESPFASSMKIAAAEVGSGFGTAIGSVPFAWLS